MKVSVLVTTPQVVLGQLLASYLGSATGLAPVRHVRWGREALAAVRRRPWAVVLLDAGANDEDPFDVGAALRRARPRTRVLYFAGQAPSGWVSRTLEVGASGYLGKCASTTDYERAIRAAVGGQRYFTPCAARVVAELASKDQRMPLLSTRERAVLRHLCAGRPSKEIATLLRMSVKGVEALRSRLMRRSGTTSSAALVRYAFCEGLIRCHSDSEPGPTY